jgi:hypothetical protein
VLALAEALNNQRAGPRRLFAVNSLDLEEAAAVLAGGRVMRFERGVRHGTPAGPKRVGARRRRRAGGGGGGGEAVFREEIVGDGDTR